MKRDWTEIVKDKLSESTATPPDDLWTGISSQLDAAMPPRLIHNKPKQWRWWAVAACLAALIVGGVYFLAPNRQETIQTAGPLVQIENPKLIKEGRLPACADHPATKESRLPACADHLFSPVSPKLSDFTTCPTPSIALLEVIPNSTSSITTEQSDSHQNETPLMSTHYDHTLTAIDKTDIYITKKPLKHTLSIGLYASNTNMPSLNGISDMDNDFVLDDYPWSGSDVGSSTDGPQYTETPTYTLKEAKHRQPLRFGLSLRFPVSSYLSLSSGLVYSRLSSTITWESAKGASFDTDQALNYIGIPASIEYNLPSYQAAGFYLTAGAMVEKCISGESKNLYSNKKEKITERALQLSVFAGAGVQLNLNNHISLYAEPLATYYIDNHSDVINIYKDRKLNLDLRVGLRYTLK